MGKASAETKGSKSWETSTGSGQQGLDAQTQQWKDMIFQAAQGAGGKVPQSVQQALDFFSGSPGAASTFMNPYQQQVIDQMNKQHGVDNQMAVNAIDDEATRGMAFGGSRHGVATGTALAEQARNHDAQIAGLLSSGFEGATGRATAAAGLGALAGSPELWRLMQLKQGFAGLPYGTNYSNTAGRTSTGMDYGFKGKIGLFGG